MNRGLAGRMRERVVLLRQQAGRDGQGAAAGDWAEIGRVWASGEPEGRGPVIAGDARTALPVWRMTMRACPVTVGDRIARTSGTIDVREVRRDPALPDRVVAIGEERR